MPDKTLGGGNLIAGFEKMNQMAYSDARKLVTHPVTCLDCHDPQTIQLRVTRPGFIEGIRLVRSSDRAMKVTDHHVQSPLLNVNRACQTCHRLPEEELRDRVHTIQDRTFQIRNVAMDALLALIDDIGRAKGAGADDTALRIARDRQRRAQFLLDFIEAENSMGFHANQEPMRVLALSIDESRRGQAAIPGR